VANFADADPNGIVGDFTAQVVWGDGTSDAGTIGTGSGGRFVVSGTHTYAADGSKPIAVTIHDAGGSSTTATGTANVTASSAAETIGGAGLNLSGYEFSPLANVAVATFTSSNPAEPANAFNATIDWGDDTTSAGSVVLTANAYTVLGTHQYSDEGNFTVQVSVGHAANPAVSATTGATATMHEELLAEGTAGASQQKYMGEIYRDVFNRQAEPNGREIWLGLLAQGATREAVAMTMLTRAASREFQIDTVAALYEQYLHRSPEPSGSESWVAYLYGGGTIEGMTMEIIGSPEYQQLRGGGTTEGFLKAVFQDALGRPIDSPALAYFEGLMAKGASAGEVAASILSSNEYRDVRVETIYEQLLDRPAMPTELESYAAELAAGARDEQIMSQLIASDEYFTKAQM
jgi:hypothetical protein